MTADEAAVGVLRYRDVVRRAAEYVPDWAGLDRTSMIRLDRNESTAPLSPHVAEAIEADVRSKGVHGYPAEYPELNAAVADYCGVSADFILPTNGSDQAIDVCLRTFLDPGMTMLVARPEFVIFGHVAELAGARVLGVPYAADLAFPYGEFRAAAASGEPDLIVFINPNNPTGTPVDPSFIIEIATRYPQIPVIVDEAYYEFTGSTVAPLVQRHPNLIVLRSFSKAFALAGLRLGYAVAQPDVVRQLVKVRGPFDVNSLAVAAARAQLTRLDEMRAYVVEQMTVIKPRVVDFFVSHGVPVWPGAANFVLVRPRRCVETVNLLRDAGILVRRMSSPALAGMFRMGLGTSAEMAHVLDFYQTLLPTVGGSEAGK